MSRIATLVAVAIGVASPLSAWSQPQPEGKSLLGYGGIGLGLNFTPYSKYNIFRDPSVQEVLKVTDAQRARLKQFEDAELLLLSNFMDRYQEQVKALGNPPDRGALAILRKSRDAFRRDRLPRLETALRDVLDSVQFARLEQIHYQTEGPIVFNRPEVQERLNLESGQIEMITGIVKRAGAELDRAARLPVDLSLDPRLPATEQSRAKFDSAVKKIQESAWAIREKTILQITNVLNERQQEKYKRIIGEPFDFKKTWNPAKPLATGLEKDR